MRLTFWGATETVTGSKYLVEAGGKKVMVDCGLFQGFKEHRLRNWKPLPVSPKDIDALILTHAHIDHSGYIPKLVKGGFRGKIYTSAATTDLCRIMLPDSGYLQEEDARMANKYGYSKHKPALPLYTKKEAEDSLKYFEPVGFGQKTLLNDHDFSFTLHRAGHILGAAFVVLQSKDTRLLFSGDLGRPHDPVMLAPEPIEPVDYLVVESTYGNRLHSQTDPTEEIGQIVRETVSHGGSVVIPAFAVGRAQHMLYHLSTLKQQGNIPDTLPIYLDSPMSINATDLMCKHGDEHRLSADECKRTCHVATYLRTAEESKQLNNQLMPCVIISASGMATGGRILHHLKHFAPHRKNTILFTGFQAEGTRGDKILRGDKTIRIHGQDIPVRARVEGLTNTSAHADYEEMLSWLSGLKTPPKKVFITHGSLESATSLQQKIQERFRWEASIPQYLDVEHLS